MRIESVFFVLATTSTLLMADAAATFQKCAVCHGEQAEKKSLGVSAIIAGWKEDKIIERLQEYRAKKLDQYGFGNMMYGQSGKLSDKEIRDVAHYISTLMLSQADADANASTSETQTTEQIAYKKYIREYFINNPKYGEIRQANKLWEEKNKEQIGK
ncbi:MAG: c-type cytochrome [Sulfuricurvum sp.]|nr:c-type cytochrome [Sulfuricurvum sp.]